MKKLIICLNVIALSICNNVSSYGKTVDESTAKTIGSNYLISMGVQGVRSASDLTTTYVAAATVKGNLVSDYYVFNINEAKGFVMVSGDDKVIPILAYSNEAPFDINKISPEARWWIDGYKDQITYVIENNVDAGKGTPERWNELTAPPKHSAARTTTVAPLLNTTWDQEPGYNMYCPSGTPTGCVATCMAEIMQFWSWPTIGTGAHTYKPPAFGLQSADFGNTAYNWTSINSSLASSNPAIATLMYHAGVAVNMNYTTSAAGSGAYVADVTSPIINCAEYAMKTYFHYKRTLRGYVRFMTSTPLGTVGAISNTAWINMIETELNAGRPLMYSGQGSSGGHVWVCDGWQGGSGTGGVVFHFNWGWSGTGPNGYYSIDAIAPPVLGTGGGGAGNNFNLDQSIVIGIEPDSFPNTTGNIKLQANLNSVNSSPIAYAAPFSFSTKVTNSNTSSFTGDFCAQVFDTSDNLMGTIQTLTGQTIAAGATSGTMTFATTAMNNLLAEDYYHVQVMYRSGSAPWAPVANNGTFINYNIFSVANDTDLTMYADMVPTPAPPATVPLGGTLSVFTQILDYNSNDFLGTLEGVLVDLATGTSYTIQTIPSCSIPMYGFNNFTFAGSVGSAPTGTYAFEVKHQYNGTGSFYLTGSRFYDNPILVHIGSLVNVNVITALENKITVYPNPANDVINISADGVRLNEIRIVDINGREVRTVDVGNQSQLSLQVNDLISGVYFIQLRAGSDVATKKIVIAK